MDHPESQAESRVQSAFITIHDAAKALIGALLSRDATTRLGFGPQVTANTTVFFSSTWIDTSSVQGWKDVMSHPFFTRIDWG